MMNLKNQPWIGNKWTDIFFVLLPPFFSLLLIFLFPYFFNSAKAIPDYWWVALILLIDVAHVYSTLYRTYFDKLTFNEQKNRLLVIPFVAFVVSVIAYNYDPMFFWRLLAYIAVFHFIRQQYGFMRIYSRKEQVKSLYKKIDVLAVYTATVYPIIYWHLSPGRNFNWFVEGDFVQLSGNDLVLKIFSVIYIIILLAYAVKEILLIIQTGVFNIPRNTVIIGTVISWYFGVVYFNGDLPFTLLNVVSHGIPYMALIWMYGKKNYGKTTGKENSFLKITFGKYGIIIFLGLIFLFAYVEEGLWDTTVWKEHTSVFAAFHLVPVKLSDNMLALIVPLLVLPQLTHYIIDGYIWRIKKKDLEWSEK